MDTLNACSRFTCVPNPYNYLLPKLLFTCITSNLFLLVESQFRAVSLLGRSFVGLLSAMLCGLLLSNFVCVCVRVCVNEQEANLTEALLSVVPVLSQLLFGPGIFCHLHHPVLKACDEHHYFPSFPLRTIHAHPVSVLNSFLKHTKLLLSM